MSVNLFFSEGLKVRIIAKAEMINHNNEYKVIKALADTNINISVNCFHI